MDLKPLGASVSNSLLIAALNEKVDAIAAPPFRFADHLTSFAERVSAEVKFIPQTFPEFTDHTADIHFPNLFSLADKLLGKELLKDLYAEELLILALGLYGHDWGMAVSLGERELIVSGQLTSGDLDPLWLLEDEQARFQKFANDYKIALNTNGYASTLPDSHWREYVRLTHADRSATRAKRFFEKIDGGVAQSVAAVCKGHWLDIQAIDAEPR